MHSPQEHHATAALEESEGVEEVGQIPADEAVGAWPSGLHLAVEQVEAFGRVLGLEKVST